MKNNLLHWSLCSLLFFTSCADDYKFVNEGIPPKAFDPNQPVVVSLIEPDSGVYNTQFVIYGKNFGTDLSRIKVYFGEKDTARLISSNGDCIYGMTPKQNDGQNKVSVVIGSEYKGELPSLFKYTRMEQITTITGTGNTGENADGTLAEAKFRVIRGMCMIADDNILVSTDQTNVRLVSEKENRVTTICSGIKFGGLGATKNRETAYGIQYDGTHAVYAFNRAKGWQMSKILNTLGTEVTGRVADCVLSDDDQFLYFCDTSGKFGRVNLESLEVEILNAELGNLGGLTSWCFIARDKVNDCFYVSANLSNKILKISSDGKSFEDYIGNGTNGFMDGNREDAMMSTVTGLAVDDSGVLYFLDTGNGLLRKLEDGIVSTVAGRKGNLAVVDGKPLESSLKWPYDLGFDSNGSLYFVECNAGMVRKFTIQ